VRGSRTSGDEAPSTDAASVFRIHERTEDYLIGTWRNIVAVCWVRCTPAHAAGQLSDVLQRVAVAHPNGLGLLTVVTASATPPPGPVRQAIARTLMASAPVIRYSAIVVEGSGFRAAMVRAIVGGITQLGRFPFPHRVVNWDEAINNLADTLDTQNTGARVGLLRAVRALRNDVRGEAHAAAPAE